MLQSVWVRYSFTVLAVAIATAVRLMLDPWLDERFVFATYFFAVFLAAWYGGFGPALLATVLGALCATYFLLPPRDSFLLDGTDIRFGLALYLLVSLGTTLLGGRMRRTRDEARALAAEAVRQREALRISEERYRNMVESAHEGIWQLDAEGRTRFANRRMAEMLRCSPKELSGSNVAQFLDEEGQQRIHTLRERRMQGIAEHVEIRFHRRDGPPLWALVSAAPLYNENGEFDGVLGMLSDISDWKRAGNTTRFLADASAALASVSDYESTLQKVATLAVPFFADWATVDMLDEHGELKRIAVAHVDPTKVELAHEIHRRYPPDPNAPQGVWNIVRTGRPELVPTITDEMLAASIRDEEQLAVLRDLGLTSYMGVPISVRGRPIGALTFIMAESARAYDAHDLAAAEDLASRAASAVENARLYQALRDSDRRKDEFLALLGHELRNPLAPISNALQVLKLPNADGAIGERARTMMERQLEHLVRLVDDLLDVSRIMSGKVELRREPVELATLIARAVETVQPHLESESHELVLELDPEPLCVDGDIVRLAQVVANLLNNAAKYTERGGRIVLRASREGDDAVLSVRDNGIGIRTEFLPRIFDMFFQAERRTREASGGLGLGLSLVRGLVEMHDGRVEAHSEGSGRGSEFIVRLPLIETARSSVEIAPPVSTAEGVVRRVLIVDDNVDAADSLAMLLRLDGQDVSVAYDGAAALVLAEARPPHIALVDLGMPVMDGFELARRFRAHEELKTAKLVAMTGWGQPEDRERTRVAGFDHHLVKPVGGEALRRLLVEGLPGG